METCKQLTDIHTTVHGSGPGRETVGHKPTPGFRGEVPWCLQLSGSQPTSPSSELSPRVKQEQHIRSLQMLKAEGGGEESFDVCHWNDRTKWTAINNSASRIIWYSGTLSFSRCWAQLGTWDKKTAFTLLNKVGWVRAGKEKPPRVNRNQFTRMHALRYTHQLTYGIIEYMQYSHMLQTHIKHHTYAYV